MADLTANTRLMFISGVWLAFVFTLLRAIGKGDFTSTRSRRRWLNNFLCCLAFSFWGASAELALDRHFGYLPLAVTIKYVCFIGVAHLFYLLLRDVQPQHAPHWLRWLAPSAITMGILGLLLYSYYQPLPVTEWRFLVIGARDSIVTVYVLLSCIPGALAMRRTETVGSMRFKLTLMVACGVIFVLTALSSSVAALMTLTHSGDASVVAASVQPIIALGLIFFMLIIVPHRWFMLLMQVPHLYTFYRLLSLEQRVLKCKGIQSSEKFSLALCRQPKELESALYRVLISIMDFYPALAKKPATFSLYKRVHERIHKVTQYPDLIQELARL